MNNTLEDAVALHLASKQPIGALLNLSPDYAALAEKMNMQRDRLARKLRSKLRSCGAVADPIWSVRMQSCFTDPGAARDYLESLRWPDKIICPHCKIVDKSGHLWPKESSRSAVRAGVWKCFVCRKQFTVTVGTALEHSHVPLNKWLLAIDVLCRASQGVSAADLHRFLRMSRKSAAALLGRVKEALEDRVSAIDRTGTLNYFYPHSRHISVRIIFEQALHALLSRPLKDRSGQIFIR